jgi:alpha-mannosidase
LTTSLTPYAIRTFAVRLAPSQAKVTTPQSSPVSLAYDLSTASNDGAKSIEGFDASAHALPAEMLPNEIAYNGIRFHLAPALTGKPNAVVARGQSIELPGGNFNRVYILAASADGDQRGTFRVGDKPVELTIEDWGVFIGQWDTRAWKQAEVFAPPEPAANDMSAEAQEARRIRAQAHGHDIEMISLYDGVKPGFIKPASLAWFASHRHTASGENEPYSYSYLFDYSIDLPGGAKNLTLPKNDKVRILAVTVANEPAQVRPAHALYDPFDRSGVDMSRWQAGVN